MVPFHSVASVVPWDWDFVGGWSMWTRCCSLCSNTAFNSDVNMKSGKTVGGGTTGQWIFEGRRTFNIL